MKKALFLILLCLCLLAVSCGESAEKVKDTDTAGVETASPDVTKEATSETTEVPGSEAATEAPETEPPATEPPETEAPETEPPATEAPATESQQIYGNAPDVDDWFGKPNIFCPLCGKGWFTTGLGWPGGYCDNCKIFFVPNNCQNCLSQTGYNSGTIIISETDFNNKHYVYSCVNCGHKEDLTYIFEPPATEQYEPVLPPPPDYNTTVAGVSVYSPGQIEVTDPVYVTMSSDPYTLRVILTTTSHISNFEVLRLEPDWTTDTNVLKISVFQTVPEFTPGKQILVDYYQPEYFPGAGVRFTDAGGTAHLLEFAVSGRDGTVFFIEH